MNDLCSASYVGLSGKGVGNRGSSLPSARLRIFGFFLGASLALITSVHAQSPDRFWAGESGVGNPFGGASEETIIQYVPEIQYMPVPQPQYINGRDFVDQNGNCPDIALLQGAVKRIADAHNLKFGGDSFTGAPAVLLPYSMVQDQKSGNVIRELVQFAGRAPGTQIRVHTNSHECVKREVAQLYANSLIGQVQGSGFSPSGICQQSARSAQAPAPSDTDNYAVISIAPNGVCGGGVITRSGTTVENCVEVGGTSAAPATGALNETVSSRGSGDNPTTNAFQVFAFDGTPIPAPEP